MSEEVKKGSLFWRGRGVSPGGVSPRAAANGNATCPVCGKRHTAGAYLVAAPCYDAVTKILRSSGAEADRLWQIGRKYPAFAGKSRQEIMALLAANR